MKRSDMMKQMEGKVPKAKGGKAPAKGASAPMPFKKGGKAGKCKA